tara:strand:- start:1165 stop:1419 length:255 start_codon:yes stop_codon:yes gene_type:complete
MLEYLTYLPPYIILGPIVLAILGVVAHVLLNTRGVKTEDSFFLVYRLFWETTGSPPNDDEYQMFRNLSEKELRQIAKTLKDQCP